MMTTPRAAPFADLEVVLARGADAVAPASATARPSWDPAWNRVDTGNALGGSILELLDGSLASRFEHRGYPRFPRAHEMGAAEVRALLPFARDTYGFGCNNEEQSASFSLIQA